MQKENHIEGDLGASHAPAFRSSLSSCALGLALTWTAGCGHNSAASPGAGLWADDAGSANEDSGAGTSGDGDALGDGDGDAFGDGDGDGDGDSVGDGDGDGDAVGDGDGDGDTAEDVDDTAEKRSAGCGKTQSGSGDFVKRTIKVGDLTRTYYLRIPSNYDKTKPYDLVTRWHGSGGDGLSGGLGIEYQSGDQAIIVGADGINNTWSNSANDLALFDALLASISGDYCIDLHRVFSYGFSAGAGFTSELSCVRGDVLRGAAMVAGYEKSAGSQCTGKVAGWFLHDSNDLSVNISMGEAARDRLLTANGCSKETTDIGEGCKQYKGCATGYPVVWCQTAGKGHDIRGDFAPSHVWAFFSGL